MIKPIIYSVFGLSLLNCQTQNKTSDSQQIIKEETAVVQKTTLKLNQPTQVDKAGLSIEFLGITEDSRCPTGTTCVWEGIAVIELSVMTPSSRPRVIQLATRDLENKGVTQSQEVYGYKITLDDLSPYPDHKKTEEKAENTISLTLKKIN